MIKLNRIFLKMIFKKNQTIILLIYASIFSFSGCAYQDGGDVKSTANLILVNSSEQTIVGFRVAEDGKWSENKFSPITQSDGLLSGEKFYFVMESCDTDFKIRVDFMKNLQLIEYEREISFPCNKTITWTITEIFKSTIGIE